MEEKTADEIAAIFSAAGDSVTVIGTAQASDETDEEFKAFLSVTPLSSMNVPVVKLSSLAGGTTIPSAGSTLTFVYHLSGIIHFLKILITTKIFIKIFTNPNIKLILLPIIV